MFVNSNVNPYQNFANYPFAKTGHAEEKKENTNIKSDLLDIKGSNLDYEVSYASEFGFRINEQGFFEKDLNKTAALPLDYDINIKSIREISKQLIKLDENLNYNKIDLPRLLNTYHNTLKTINHEFQKNDNNFLSKAQISELNQGYSYTYEGKILKVYENAKSLQNAKETNKNLNTLMLDNKIGDFAFNASIENTASNPIIRPYLNRQGEVSKSGLLLNYIYNDLKEQNNQKANFFLTPIELDISSNVNFQKLMRGQMSMQDYLSESNKEKMSFDLYLYINGVDKNNTTEDKLSVFFQQYINYQHSINMQEFANSSSIYSLYSEQISKDFEALKKEFNQNDSNIDLEKINTQKELLDTQFLENRKRQASINKILHSYLNAMA
ncbi:hypothetical protein L8V89_06220 [Campylobacter lari]|uniref:hypothetical protein n=1 Tax=Campylobacter lari TaxID=201 RepID=UPI0012799C0D|nr:hypothetical protein [Campylobacter lari]EAJ0335134.1 hypothetical protein [Campylobacter lari]EAK0493806.1 hypothetical protein [Campylobacter lari]EAK9999430.1 hypothetical protein [Campylobacter lari]EFO9448056.1 hypothetical protein [Campylobacter lari]MCR2068614.1 hypothetical protein [Campylobacter lari subsp. concheus]